MRYSDPDGKFVPAIALAVTAPEWGPVVLEGLAIAGAAIIGIVTGQTVGSKINEARENKAEQAKKNLKDNAQAAAPSPAPQNQDDNDKTNKKPSSQNQMQKQVERGQAPKDVDRVDKAHQKGQQPHVHFNDKTALNQDGTVHDAHNGSPNLSNEAKEWLKNNGWNTGE